MRTAAALLILFPVLALATDRGDDVRVTQSNDMNNQTAGDVITGTGDSNNIALGNALGDVDIADCLASTQFSIVVFARQGVKLNAWCAAAAYDRAGLHETAARLRCTIPEIAKLFEDDQACMTGNLVRVATVEPPPEPEPEPAAAAPPEFAEVPLEDDDEQAEHDELAEALAQLRADFEHEQDTRQRAARRAAQQREAERQEAAEFLERYQQATEPPPPQDEENAVAERENN